MYSENYNAICEEYEQTYPSSQSQMSNFKHENFQLDCQAEKDWKKQYPENYGVVRETLEDIYPFIAEEDLQQEISKELSVLKETQSINIKKQAAKRKITKAKKKLTPKQREVSLLKLVLIDKNVQRLKGKLSDVEQIYLLKRSPNKR